MAAYGALDPATEEEAPFRGRSAARCGLSSDERDFLRSSNGLPVEGVGRHRDLLGLDGARPLPGMAAGGSVRALVGLGPGGIRHREGDRLVVAGDEPSIKPSHDNGPQNLVGRINQIGK